MKNLSNVIWLMAFKMLFDKAEGCVYNRCLKNVFHQLKRNEWLLLSAFQQGLWQKLVFVLTLENAVL